MVSSVTFIYPISIYVIAYFIAQKYFFLGIGILLGVLLVSKADNSESFLFEH